jgi:hypothetical protein
MRIKLLGFGEVGKAIYTLFVEEHEVFIQDPALGLEVSESTHDKGLDVLLVCIPFSDNFMIEVQKARVGIDKVVIFSSVPMGTTAQIKNAIHIPIEGKHPNLEKHLKDWEVLVGIDKDNLYMDFYKEFISSVFTINVLTPTEVSEGCKLLSTLLYGIQIEYMRYAAKVLGGNYEYFNLYNDAYNKLYKKVNVPVSRSLLAPPEGLIGGHCVRQNAEYLNSFWSEIVKMGLGKESKETITKVLQEG